MREWLTYWWLKIFPVRPTSDDDVLALRFHGEARDRFLLLQQNSRSEDAVECIRKCLSAYELLITNIELSE